MTLTQRAKWVRLGRRLGGERWLFLLARLLYRLRIEGEQHIPKTGACLFPFNHVSQPADLLVNALIRRHRPDVYLFGWQGWQGENPLVRFLATAGEPDPEGRVLRAIKAQGLSAGELLRARTLLLQGRAIALAAEGEITWDGRLQHLLAPGAVWLALRTAAPLVPVVSVGGYDLQPRWQMERIRWNGRLTLRIGPPLRLCQTPVSQLDDAALAEANQRLWEAMAALLR